MSSSAEDRIRSGELYDCQLQVKSLRVGETIDRDVKNPGIIVGGSNTNYRLYLNGHDVTDNVSAGGQGRNQFDEIKINDPKNANKYVLIKGTHDDELGLKIDNAKLFTNNVSVGKDIDISGKIVLEKGSDGINYIDRNGKECYLYLDGVLYAEELQLKDATNYSSMHFIYDATDKKGFIKLDSGIKLAGVLTADGRSNFNDTVCIGSAGKNTKLYLNGTELKPYEYSNKFDSIVVKDITLTSNDSKLNIDSGIKVKSAQINEDLSVSGNITIKSANASRKALIVNNDTGISADGSAIFKSKINLDDVNSQNTIGIENKKTTNGGKILYINAPLQITGNLVTKGIKSNQNVIIGGNDTDYTLTLNGKEVKAYESDPNFNSVVLASPSKNGNGTIHMVNDQKLNSEVLEINSGNKTCKVPQLMIGEYQNAQDSTKLKVNGDIDLIKGNNNGNEINRKINFGNCTISTSGEGIFQKCTIADAHGTKGTISIDDSYISSDRKMKAPSMFLENDLVIGRDGGNSKLTINGVEIKANGSGGTAVGFDGDLPNNDLIVGTDDDPKSIFLGKNLVLGKADNNVCVKADVVSSTAALVDTVKSDTIVNTGTTSTGELTVTNNTFLNELTVYGEGNIDDLKVKYINGHAISSANDAFVPIVMAYNPTTNEAVTDEETITYTDDDKPSKFTGNVVVTGSILSTGEKNVIGVGLYDDKDKQTYMTATSLHTKRVYADTLIPVDSETNAINIGDKSTNYKLLLNGKYVGTTEGSEFTSLKFINEDGTKYVEVAKNLSVDDGITIKGKVDVGDDLNVYGTVYTDTLEARTTDSPVAIKKAKIDALENLNTFTYTATIKTRSDATSTKDTTVTVTLERIIGNLRRCTIKQSGDNNVAAESWIQSGKQCYMMFTPTEGVPEDLIPTNTVPLVTSIVSTMVWNDAKTNWTAGDFLNLFAAVGESGQVQLLFIRNETTELACTNALSGISFFY